MNPTGLPEGPAPTEEQLMELLAMLQEQGITPEQFSQTPNLEQLLDNVKRKKGVPLDKDVEEITPEPGFVIKTLDEHGQKVFINVCGHDRIPAPGGWSDGQVPESVKKALENAENLSSEEASVLRFPLSLGPPRLDMDRRGERCRVFDAILNRDVVKQAAVVKRLKAFLIELCLAWVAQKAKCELDPKYRLPKMKYKGEEVMPQTIRAEKKRLIEEVGDVQEEPTFALPTKKLTPEQQLQAQKIAEVDAAADKDKPGKHKKSPQDESSSSSASSFSFGGAPSSRQAAGAKPRIIQELDPEKDSESKPELRSGTGASPSSTAAAAGGAGTTSTSTGGLELESLSYEGRPVSWVVVRVSVSAGNAESLLRAAEAEASAVGGSVSYSSDSASSSSDPSESSAPSSPPDEKGDWRASQAVLSSFRIQVIKGGRELRVHASDPGRKNDVLKVPLAVATSGEAKDGAVATLSEDCRTLEVRLPYISVRQRVAELRRRRPLTFGSLDLCSASEALDLEP